MKSYKVYFRVSDSLRSLTRIQNNGNGQQKNHLTALKTNSKLNFDKTQANRSENHF